MLDFNSAPLHLTMPLSVDTNIDYTLDMAKFPGLNDPRCIKEFALLPSAATNNDDMEVTRVCNKCGSLLPFNTDSNASCGFCVYYGITAEVTETDELYSLIASCDIDTDYTSVISGDLQLILEDIMESTSSLSQSSSSSPVSPSAISYVTELSPLSKLSPLSPMSSSQFTQVISETNKDSICETDEILSVHELNRDEELSVTYQDLFTDSTCAPVMSGTDVSLVSPAVVDTTFKKRKLSTDCDYIPCKRQKGFDMEDLLMNCYLVFSRVNICSDDKTGTMSRES